MTLLLSDGGYGAMAAYAPQVNAAAYGAVAAATMGGGGMGAGYAAYGQPQAMAARPAASGSAAGHSLFVYNIPHESDETWLAALFQSYGTITETKVIRDPTTQMCKGYGFVRLANMANAQAAISALNGAQVGGRTLQVSLKKN